MTYDEYIESPLWQTVRQECFREHGHRCIACKVGSCVQAHHVYYPRDITRTRVNHVMPLCDDCHDTVHQSGIEATTKIETEVERVKLVIRNFLAKLPRVQRGVRRFECDVAETFDDPNWQPYREQPKRKSRWLTSDQYRQLKSTSP